jgi:polyhydroxyalkanoate synthesis regulator phasin
LKEAADATINQYKAALGKYRTQLKEMAVFNTNLAHVNNILINEELALTQPEKIKIINEFKNINDITESQNKYKSVISEMKKGKKPITESIEDKVSASIQPSSKQKLDEVTEKTTYVNNEHMRRMQKVIDYVERR